MTDRILTIKQPWANAIMRGDKDVECRTWSTDYRGRVWVHAGLSVDRDAMWTIGHVGDDEPRGVILGHVELVDVVDDSDSPWAQPGCYHWLLANPVRCRPVQWQGGLGLRQFPGLRAAKQTAYAAC